MSLKRIQSFLLCDEYTPIGPGELKNEGIKLETVSAVYETIQPNDIQSNPQSKELLERTQEISLLLSQLNDAEQEIQKLTGISSTEERNTNPICVRRVTLECKPGSFIAVVGSVGSGKTSLVNTILGEVKQLSGKTSVKGNLAYFSQTPFIMNASVRDNILFSHLGEPIDEDMYQRCLDCCALRHDIALLPDGDKTEIGEKGITLSGGQKARVALAR